MTRFPALRRQRGVTLIVALIMLILITLLAVTTFNLGKSSLQVVGNMQSRNEGVAAARQTLEETLSSTRFSATPADAIASPCNGVANTRCVDTNGDGKTDITVQLTPKPACLKARAVKSTELDLTNQQQSGCVVGTPQSFGVAGAVTGNSLCSDSMWELNAVATDAVTEARTEVVQGIEVRVPTDDIVTTCP